MQKTSFNYKKHPALEFKSALALDIETRKKLSIQNKKIVSRNNPPKLKFNLSFSKPTAERITWEEPITIFPGNYCYPITENYFALRDKKFFFRYFGEEKIEKISKWFDVVSADSTNDIPDDLWTDIWIIQLVINGYTFQQLKEYFVTNTNNNDLKKSSVIKRVRKTHDRLRTAIPFKLRDFYFLSLGMNEEKTHESWIGTNKQLFCSICWKYDCILHDYLQGDFDSSNCKSVKDYWRSYRRLHIGLPESQSDSINSNNSDDNWSTHQKENKYLDQLIKNIDNYNSVIIGNKICQLSGVINNGQCKNKNGKDLVTPANNISNVNQNYSTCYKGDCGKFCYKHFMNLNENLQDKIYNNIKQLPNIFELFLTKMVQIFQYDPCAISQVFKLISIKEWQDSHIQCYIIYLRLISDQYSISLPITKQTLDLFGKEKANDKRRFMEPNRLKQIKMNVANNRIIPYTPCTHLSSETCNEKCPCFTRGFCEKYCWCNKHLCKLIWTGCHCKGPCNNSWCPCYVNNRECDIDICQNCKTPEQSLCRNIQLQRSQKKNLGVSNSNIVDWGWFAKEEWKKDDLIGEYIGELIDNDDWNERSEFIDFENSTYMFTLNDDYTIDSRNIGNYLRFANHSKLKANAYTKIIFANGCNRICWYASTNIQKHEEILFDYDGQNVLCNKYDWINDNKEKKDKPNNTAKNNKAVKREEKWLNQKRFRKNYQCKAATKWISKDIDKSISFNNTPDLSIHSNSVKNEPTKFSIIESKNENQGEWVEDKIRSTNWIKSIFGSFRKNNNLV